MTPREDIRRIAAEYVIGTLDSAERAAWRARMGREPEVAALVALWERRFFPLHELSAPARPPENLFDLILSRLPLPAGSAPEDAPDIAGEQQSDHGPAEAACETPPEEAVSEIPEVLVRVAEDATPESAVVPEQTAEDAPIVHEAPTEDTPANEAAAPVLSGGEVSLEEECAEPAALQAAPEEPELPASQAASEEAALEEAAPEETAPEPVPPAVEHPQGGQGAAPDRETFAFERPVPPPVPVIEPAERANPWRVASGLLMLALLLGGGAFAYRELHHRTPAPQPEPPKVAEAPPITPAPAEPPPPVPETFAVLGPQPVPAIGFAFDHRAGTVSVLKMAVPPRAGTHYHLWLVTEMDGTHHVAQFDAPGTYPSELLQDVDAAALAGALLVVTEEEEGPPPPAPTGAPVFSGMAVKR